MMKALAEEGMRAEVLLAPLAAGMVDGASGLSADEAQRAATIGDEVTRSRYCAARQLLRSALARRTGRSRSELTIVVTPSGRPVLAGVALSFSLAHSERWCAIAISQDGPIGVDIEEVRHRSGLEDVTEHVMPARAQRQILDAAPADRTQAALHWWVRIEAAVKACDGTLDEPDASLCQVRDQVSSPVNGVLVAVAGQTPGPLTVTWRVS